MRGEEVTIWRKLPICLLGFVQGEVRWELCGGGDKYQDKSRFFAFYRPKEHALTHIQYRSRFGFLLMWPLAFYFWLAFKKGTPNKVPHDEIVLNGRMGARWEAGRCLYIWPSFYLGLHFD